MPLKTIVKASGITNLSDARYCAGMGVDFLGFQVSPEHPDFIPLDLYRDIRGWVTGPKFVAEIADGAVADTDKLIADYAPDFLELDVTSYMLLKKTPALPIILRLDQSNISTVDWAMVAYVVVDDIHIHASVASKILVRIQDGRLISSILEKGLGIEVKGSQEVRPGYKDFTSLADILEQLDE